MLEHCDSTYCPCLNVKCCKKCYKNNKCKKLKPLFIKNREKRVVDLRNTAFAGVKFCGSCALVIDLMSEAQRVGPYSPNGL